VTARDRARPRNWKSIRLRSAIAAAAIALAAGAPVIIARAQDAGAPSGGPATAPQQGAADAQGNAAPSPSGMIQFPNIPRITLQVLPGYGPAPLMVGFLVMSANPEAAPFVSYRWSFGDGQISTLPPTVLFHSYKNPGTYTVTVTATTADGQNASGFAGVTVTQPAN
jgi:PKD repeat protein